MQDSFSAETKASEIDLFHLGYQNPTRRLFGEGSLEKLPLILRSFRPQRILLCLGQKSFRASSHFKKLEAFLKPYPVLGAQPIPENPKQDFLQGEIDRLKKETFDLVLAIGGGSVLDTAKFLASVPKERQTDLDRYVRGRSAPCKKGVPLIAIPTTAGTGSEVTPFASLETRDRQKVTVSQRDFFPAVAMIDPQLTYSMPAYVTACAGFDALSQAIESFWSVRATPFSRIHSLRALDLLLRYFGDVMQDLTDINARSAMALGSCEAGLAIAQTMTTAVHSVSYPMTSFFSIPHGHACALTLSSFVLFNAPVLKEDGRALLKAFGVSDYDEMARQIVRLMDTSGLERRLSSLGIDEEGMAVILQEGFRPDRMNNNPRPVSQEDLQKILMGIR